MSKTPLWLLKRLPSFKKNKKKNALLTNLLEPWLALGLPEKMKKKSEYNHPDMLTVWTSAVELASNKTQAAQGQWPA